MTKTPAKKTPAKKISPGKPAPKAAAKGTRVPAKAPAKAPARTKPPAAKSAKGSQSTKVAKPAPARTTTAKPARGKPVATGKVAVKASRGKPSPSRPVAAPARSRPPAVPAPKPHAVLAKPAPSMKPVPAPKPLSPAPAPVAAPITATLAAVIPRKAGRGASKYATPAVQAPLPPPTSRFADRFAPPRPPTRQMNNLELDTPREKQKFDPKLANAWKSKAGRELSEPEVLAMPEAEYMNDKQLEFFRVKLQTLKDDLLSNAGETTEHLREDTSIVPDPADRATIEEEHALELRTRDRERKLLKKISQSLARIDAGDYGFCDETGEPIGLGRLIARPTATLSLEAQQRRELKQKMFGD